MGIGGKPNPLFQYTEFKRRVLLKKYNLYVIIKYKNI